MNQRPPARETRDVDIVKEEEIDEGDRSVERHRKRSGIIVGSTIIITASLISCFLLFTIKPDANDQRLSWAMQTLTLLIGAALGFLFGKEGERRK